MREQQDTSSSAPATVRTSLLHGDDLSEMIERPAVTRRRRAGSAVATAAAALTAAATIGVVGMSQRAASTSASRATKDLAARVNAIPLAIDITDEYSRRDRLSIGEGLYPYTHLAQIHKPTVLAVSDAAGATTTLQGSVHSPYAFRYAWKVPSLGVDSASGEELEVTYDALGYHTVRLERSLTIPAGILGGASVEFEPEVLELQVMAKYVRRELRSMSDGDRNGFFEALKLIYTTGQADGVAAYGSKYRSIECVTTHARRRTCHRARSAVSPCHVPRAERSGGLGARAEAHGKQPGSPPSTSTVLLH